MSETALEAVLRSDRAIVVATLAVLTALAWIYVLQQFVRHGAALPPSIRGSNRFAVPHPRFFISASSSMS
jgi:predicted metal-binding membrane protein